MGTIEKRGKNSWRIGTQVQTENGWEWVRDTIHLPGTMSEAKQRKEAEKALARLIVDVEEGRAKPTSQSRTRWPPSPNTGWSNTSSQTWPRTHTRIIGTFLMPASCPCWATCR